MIKHKNINDNIIYDSEKLSKVPLEKLFEHMWSSEGELCEPCSIVLQEIERRVLKKVV